MANLLVCSSDQGIKNLHHLEVQKSLAKWAVIAVDEEGHRCILCEYASIGSAKMHADIVNQRLRIRQKLKDFKRLLEKKGF